MPSSRPALVEMRQGRIYPVLDVGETEEGWDIPIVDPSTLPTVGQKPKAVPFSLDQMVTVGSMKEAHTRWAKIVQTLRDREGTVYDITGDMLSCEDQTSLTAVREGRILVYADHVFAAVRGTATWPTVLAVESWLRDALMMSEEEKIRKVAVMLWSVVTANAVGAEAIRAVVHHCEQWTGFDVRAALCGGKCTEIVSAVLKRRAYCAHDHLWTNIMLAVDRASEEAFWDWRCAPRKCWLHQEGKCGRAETTNYDVSTTPPLRQPLTQSGAREMNYEDDLDDEDVDDEWEKAIDWQCMEEELASFKRHQSVVVQKK